MKVGELEPHLADSWVFPTQKWLSDLTKMLYLTMIVLVCMNFRESVKLLLSSAGGCHLSSLNAALSHSYPWLLLFSASQIIQGTWRKAKPGFSFLERSTMSSHRTLTPGRKEAIFVCSQAAKLLWAKKKKRKEREKKSISYALLLFLSKLEHHSPTPVTVLGFI
jgi:hypothetical protein